MIREQRFSGTGTAREPGSANFALLRRLATMGVAGPLLFVVGIVVGGAVTPGYSHLSDPVSQLAATGQPYPFIQMTGFVLFGLAIVATGLGLWRLPLTGRAARTGQVLLIIAGTSMVLTGLFRADPMQQESLTTSGTLHLITAMVLFLSVSAAFLFCARAFRRANGWGDRSRFSLVAGLAAIAFLLTYSVAFELQPEMVGLWQRLFAATIVTWFVVVASRLRGMMDGT